MITIRIMLDMIRPMRVSLCIATFLVPFLISTTICFFGASTTIFAAQIDSPSEIGTDNCHHDYDQHKEASTSGCWSERENMMEKPQGDEGRSEMVGSTSRKGRTLQIAGSRLPDCLHACGSCTPCRLVMVSFACASHTDEAESYPVSYRCMCNSRSHPVP